MNWTIPGTVLVQPREEADRIPQQFSAMFLAGGLTLGQVSGITGLEPYTVQNWVKRGFLAPPEKKRYTLQQLCRVICINMLKNALPMEKVCALLGYINGQLDDSSDDLIDDAALFFLFTALAARVRELDLNRDSLLDQFLESYREPVPGARERVRRVLQVMLTAWLAARMRQEAEQMLRQLETP
jgi:DNA-binding transcriptional MerR regulator